MKFYEGSELDKFNSGEDPTHAKISPDTSKKDAPKEKLGKRIKKYFKTFFKTEGEKLKEMTFGEKLKYIWAYYKVHIIITVGFIVLAVSLGKVVYRNIKYDSIFHCAMVNNMLSSAQEEYIIKEFGNYINIDKEHETLTFDSGYMFMWDNSSFSDTNYTSRMKVASALAARVIDIFVADKTYIISAAPEGQLYDLKTILPENIYTAVEDKLFYTAGEDGVERAYAVDLSSSKYTYINDPEKGILYPEPPYYGIVINTEHLETSIEFLKFILDLE
ncbi:MAG: hypothetical protein E7261_08005 [Lachnospiraceae bacterium]|nr:hypothetical protein [Lachnospiraceae bacterium]